jgi:hypothetical protein
MTHRSLHAGRQLPLIWLGTDFDLCSSIRQGLFNGCAAAPAREGQAVLVIRMDLS